MFPRAAGADGTVRLGKGKGALSQSKQVTSAAASGRAQAGGQDPKCIPRQDSWWDATGSRAWLSDAANSSALSSQQVAKGAGQGRCLPRATAQAQVKEEEERREGEEENQAFAESVGLSFSAKGDEEEKNEAFAEPVDLSISTTTPGEESEGSEGDWDSPFAGADAFVTELRCSPRWVGKLRGVPGCCGQASGRTDDEWHGDVVEQHGKVSNPGMGQGDATDVEGLLAWFSWKLPGAMELPRPPDGGRRSAMVEGIDQASLPRPPEGHGWVAMETLLKRHFAELSGGGAWQCMDTVVHDDRFRSMVKRAVALPEELQSQLRECLSRLRAQRCTAL